MSRDRGKPPRLAQALLALLVPPRDRDALLGDFAEAHARRRAAAGSAAARLAYWREVLASLPSLFVLRRRRARRPPLATPKENPVGHLSHALTASLRNLRRHPGFSLLVICTLALGLGAATLVYGTVDGLVLNPFPFPEPGRLVGVGSAFPRLERDLSFWENLSMPEIEDIRTQAGTLEKLVAWDMGQRQVTFGEETDNLFTGFWWGDALPTLGLPPHLGRGFLPGEVAAGERVALVSHRTWLNRLGGDRDRVGETLRINGEPYTLIGVLPPGALVYGMDLWLPMPVAADSLPRGRRQFQFLARLAPDADGSPVTLERANLELETIARRAEQEHGAEHEEYAGWRLEARTWTDINVQGMKPTAVLLLGSVVFVLLLVCANVANLLLVRGAQRQREMAVRSALGAGQGRLLGQLTVESLLLAVLGGAIGLGLAGLGLQALQGALSQMGLPLPVELGLEPRVLLFALAATLVVGILVAWLPARRVVGAGLREALHGARGSVGGGRLAVQRLIVGVEVALAVMLLVGGGLLVRSFLELQAVEPGFDTENLLTFRVTLAPERYDTPAAQDAFFQELERRVEALPGVSRVALASQLPPSVFSRRQFTVEGAPPPPEDLLPEAFTTLAGEGYREAFRIPLLQGRDFDARDRAGSPPVALINRIAAERFFDGDAVGQRFRLQGGETTFEVVGVIGDVHNRGLDVPPQPELLALARQLPGAWNQLFLVTRTEVPPRTVLPAVRQAIRALDPEQPIYAVATVEEYLASDTRTRRVATTLLSIFALFALALAAVGIYGVVSYSVSRRTREIGLRMALGAGRGEVRRWIVLRSLLPVVIGAGVGLGGALALGRGLSSLLYEVGSADPLALTGALVLLAMIALAATVIPAWRASRLDPLEALRVE